VLLLLSSWLTALLAATAAGTPQPPAESPRPSPPAYVVALYEPGPAWVRDLSPHQQPGIEEHAVYMDKLAAEGKLRLGGPLLTDPQRMELSGALLVIDADSLEEARALVTADPALKAGLMKLKELHHFLVYVGGLAPGGQVAH